MEAFEIRNLSFSYPEQTVKALRNVSLTISSGEFIVLCGPSGCGKSTLLRQLKTVLRPHGVLSGEVLFCGEPLDSVDDRRQSAGIGFVQQSPENQVVTDKVWHELAFGMESLGYDTPTIRRRVAEMASFFGIQNWFYKNVTELSGGQKQLLNLASIMAMQPEVLILDEPTSQLDPIAASDFLATVGKINRELGTTVILTEHRLEEAFPMASRVAVMDRGTILCTGTPEEVGLALRGSGHSMFLAMPTAMRVWAAVPDSGETCPVTVRDGRDWLGAYAESHTLGSPEPEPERRYPDETVIRAEELWFRYEKDQPDVVKGLSLEVRKGEFYTILGGNGAGKSTTLKLLAGLVEPYRGTIEVSGRLGMLPQDPKTLFVKKTVREDLKEIFRGLRVDSAVQEERLRYIVRLCRLEELLDRHPYDLSGGEQQRAALAKVLLLDPEILLMDEPTKGLDAEFKQILAQILASLVRRGVTIVMVSHDIEFCARYAHRCAMFFDGGIVCSETPRTFFMSNNFYTTSANRMAREIIPDAVTPEDVMTACGGELPPAPELIDDGEPLPPPAETSPDYVPRKLPLWRKLLGAAAGIAAAVVFVYAMRQTDLSALISPEGLTALSWSVMRVYLVFIAAMALMAFALNRRSPPRAIDQTPVSKRKLSKRTIAAAVMILLLIPLTLFVGIVYLGDRKYYFIALLVLLECIAPFFLVFEGRKPQARELVIIAVLCAIAVAGRAAFFMFPNFSPVIALVIISGVAFGGESGFLVGAVTMLVSNIMFSQGPWTPWQMFAMGIIGFLAGVIFRKGLLRRSKIGLCIYGAIAAVVIYGGIMNPAAVLIYSDGLDPKMIISYYLMGFPLDCVQAAATVITLVLVSQPMLEKLDRIKVKYGLVE
ncbi:MAG: ATP-binding cassette domain-containing protein [Oscillospiraceae bacterium]|nr:ATP-binding cassette domain-containing protein [Oscillospiraceae bacterium]